MKLAISIICCFFLLVGYSHADEYGDDGFQWKDLRAACKGNHDSEECAQMRAEAREFCQAHPDKKRCRKLHAMKECRHNPDSENCQEYKERFKAHCEEHPGSKKCVRAKMHRICKDDPESEECLAAKERAHHYFCEKHPNHDKCT